MHGFRQTIGGIALIALIALAGAAPLGAQEDPTPEQDNETIVITGHGWGHGRGMSQYGSLGYAVDFGWTSPEILDHYYGGTTAGSVPNDLLTVRIDSANDLPTVAAVDSGALVLMDATGTVTHVGRGGAIRLTSTPDGFIVGDADSCGGPFVDRDELISAEQIRISTVSGQRSGGTVAVGPGHVVVGDWDGDGDDDLGTVDAGTWKLWTSGPTTAGDPPTHTFAFGAADGSAVPLVGDWNGDGIDTPAVYEGGTWQLRSGLGAEADTSTFAYGGNAEDAPVVGDWDGDGDDDHGIKRGRAWMLRADDGTGPPTWTFNYGRVADAPVVGDWNGDGTDDFGFVRGTIWQRRIGITGDIQALATADLGPASAQPIVGDWDGDGIGHLGRVEAGVADLIGPLTSLVPRIDPDIPLEHTVQRCVSTSEQRFYRGELRAVANNGNQRTVNAVPVESYLRAVVPLEMPASWANLAEGAGAEAVQTQAVSARSYALAEDRTSYARTCDTISCQVYGGRAVRRDGVVTSNENPLSDQAILDTAGVVRMRDGEVARTEFSSSTGGWTAGGVFPAVEDLGDAVSINPNHDWAVVLPVAEVEARWSGRTLDRLEVTERNGLGEDGGRVYEVTLTFGDEVFTMTGNEFRRAYGLKSDWFTVDWERWERRTDCICPQDWPDHGLDRLFVDDAGG